MKQLPISTRSAATASDIRHIPYWLDIKIPDVNINEVMLLIGTDTPEAHIPLDVRTGSDCEPYAVRTRLGWAVRGPIPRTSTEQKRAANVREPVNIHFGQSSDVILQQQLERMSTSDFSDTSHYQKDSMSVEDKRALGLIDSTLSFVNGHYEMGLPWRQDDASLPNNLTLAHARLHQLKRKLSRDNVLHEMYTKTVTDYIDKGYAKEVTNEGSKSKRIWYLPHHPVTNVNKPGKVRVVFDCAADIEAMFHQVRVCEKDCDALRFLWWPGGNMSKTPKTYCMRIHLFGATSSPSCEAYALKKTASDSADKFEAEVISTVDRNFYVDDCLKSVPSEMEAVNLAADLQSLMHLGGFRLTKWISNSRTLLNTIPDSERAPTLLISTLGTYYPVTVHWASTGMLTTILLHLKSKLQINP
ncbi:uncharacterized protein LOC123563639 [Mercenaria mercenaria]|uniref:uncharacterized protein LOC123563639 n=1 Tax=Mercenaria mercenaria TaxID=6596 RepID=UPI00234F31DA|nr:uncharacterized protein LOC123563639 [Mercenaria mercenaria]